MGATPANMEVYVRLAESAAAGEFNADLDSSAGSSLSHSGRYDSLSSSLKNHTQRQQDQQDPLQEEPKGAGNGLVAGSSTGFAPISEVGHEGTDAEASAERRAPPRPPRERGMPAPLRRREGMSDVWQQQGAFRSNRKSMKSIFEEVSRERGGWRQCTIHGRRAGPFCCFPPWLSCVDCSVFMTFFASDVFFFLMYCSGPVVQSGDTPNNGLRDGVL